jgi:hypothetical protein
VIALIADTPSLWHGSPLRANHVIYSRYGRFPQEILMISEELQNYRKQASPMHVFSNYPMTGDANKRYLVARETWAGRTRGITDSQLVRWLAGMPYIKDIIRQATIVAQKDDIIILHNSDICFYDGAIARIEESVRTHGSAYALRHDYDGDPRIIKNPGGHRIYPGSDMFAFTKKWWQDNQSSFPDMVIGREAWDKIMRTMIQHLKGVEVPDSIYHFKHKSHWITHRMTDKGNVHNRKLAREWLKKRKLPLEELRFSERF